MKLRLVIFLSLLLASTSCKHSKEHNNSGDKNIIDAEALIQINKQFVKNDINRNIKYADQHGWDYTISENGIIYEILEDFAGLEAKSGDPVEFSYDCKLLNGQLCYSSVSDGLKKFIIDYDEIESGINDIAKMLSSGDSARIILAPHHAYGVAGDGSRVPARSCLVYHLKLLKIHARD